MVTTESVTIKVPVGMSKYLVTMNPETELTRNALLLYPYILNQTISHGRAAEILGIRKSELIDLYDKLGYSYFDMTMDDLDDEWVYITPYGTVYHRDRACRYLDLNIRAVSRQSLLTLRNADRKIYRPCESCGLSGNRTVYVTDYGERYHNSLSCSGLKRTIYMIKLSQTGGKKACSKCGARQQS